MIEPASLTFDQIRTQVAAIRRKVHDAPFYGIRTHSRWLGERKIVHRDDVFYIDQCDSPLQMRVAMQQEPEQDGIHVLVTPLSDRELGPDVLVRLPNRQCYPIDDWRNLKSLFGAREIDARIAEHKWIAELLLQFGADSEYPSVPGGLLDAETVWHILLERQIGLSVRRPDLIALLKWSMDPENVARLKASSDAFKEAAAEWLAETAGVVAIPILNVVAGNPKPDAVPLGLVLGVIHDQRVAGDIAAARVRLEERYTGRVSIPSPIADRWYEAATSIVSLQLDDRQRQTMCERADEILAEIEADQAAWASKTSPHGYQQLLSKFGKALSATVAANYVCITEDLVPARDAILEHQQRRFDTRRRDRIEMAMRLTRWLESTARTVTAAGSLPQAVHDYALDGGFIDWARNVLVVDEPVADLARGFADLRDRVTSIRQKQNQEFAELLKGWTAADSTSDDVIPVETVLKTVVAPLAAESPVLLIVMDGMSVSVCRELMVGMLHQDWVEVRPAGRTEPLTGLAAIPSVTEASRTSLLCGKLRQGSQADEKRSFPRNSDLLKCCEAGYEPELFHKGDLYESGGAGLASNVRQSIEDRRRKVVGVVVNAIDDHLTKGEQLDTLWTRETIKVLPSLLHAAKLGKRTVVLVSDHGHVLDFETKTHSATDAHERWRPDDGQLQDGEIVIKGPRVVVPRAKQLIAPWAENLRYTTQRNGYHGGVTLQEMVIPIVVLSPTLEPPAGWEEAAPFQPNWWEVDPVSVEVSEAVPGPPKLKSKSKPTKTAGTLFDLEDEETEENRADREDTGDTTSAPWISALLASPVFEDQKKLGGRIVPDDKVFVQLLSALDQRGGKLTSAALARTIKYSPMRLRGMLAVVQRVLNIDGYAVLTREETSDTVELDRNLLCRQFDLLEKTQ